MFRSGCSWAVHPTLPSVGQEVAPPALQVSLRPFCTQPKKIFTLSVFKTVVALSLLLSGLSAFALDREGIERSIQLKDCSTVHVFKDGKMAMEDKLGRPSRMKPGQTMQTTDGQPMTMKGDEVARLSNGQRVHLRP